MTDKKTVDKKSNLCLNCGEPHNRNADTCSGRCYAAYKIKTTPQKCAICDGEYFSRGKTCSREHANELKKRTNIEKFGSEWAIQSGAAKDKRKATNLKRYGVEHHLQTEESMARLRATNLERYGVEFVGQNEEAKEKIRKTNLDRYGVETPLQSPTIKEAIKTKNLELYGVEYAVQRNDVIESIRKTNIERFGVENPFAAKEVIEKIRKRNLELYGVEYAVQREDVKTKIRATNLERYGDEIAARSQQVQDKMKRTNLERYGYEYPIGSPEGLEKVNATNLDRYGVKRPLQNTEIQARAAATIADGIASGRIQLRQRVSKLNRSFAEAIKTSFNLEVQLEVSRGGNSFDLYIPEHSLFIELNPTISHNADRSYSCMIGRHDLECGHGGLKRNYHQKRAIFARDNGLKLIQIYDWDIEPLTTLLDGKLRKGFEKFSARKLKLEVIDQKTANKFLKLTHSQGSLRGQTYCYGLYDSDRLIAVATFGKSRFGSSAEYEFLRYAVARGSIVYGGAAKLFNHFISDAKPISVVSYVNLDHSTGPSFLTGLDFVEGKPTSPALIWSKGDKRVSSTSLLMRGADNLLGTSYGSREESGMNNEDIMRKEGWNRVYTSGNRVFLWSKP